MQYKKEMAAASYAYYCAEPEQSYKSLSANVDAMLDYKARRDAAK